MDACSFARPKLPRRHRPLVFCTYFDHRYLSRALALHASLQRHCGEFLLYALCMTEECHAALIALSPPGLIPIRLEELEAADPELLRVKPERSAIEYYFTCGPAFVDWLFKADPTIEVLTYLDADLFFFASPDPVFDAFEDHSILIVRHDFSHAGESERLFGRYNVGWISLRRDGNGTACAAWWRKACLEWCRDVPEAGRYADQKYLEEFPRRWPVQENWHPGVNLAPWNVDNYRFAVGRERVPLVDGRPVIAFHFHGLRRIAPFLWYTTHHIYGTSPSSRLKEAIYGPYLAELNRIEAGLQARFPALSAPLERHSEHRLPIQLLGRIWSALSALRGGGASWLLGERIFTSREILTLQPLFASARSPVQPAQRSSADSVD
jgi:hypothetical protein